MKEQWRLHQWGVRDGFVQGTLDMINFMMKSPDTIEGIEAKAKSSRTLRAIITTSAVSAAIGAAATLSFFNSIATRTKIDAIDNAVEPDKKQPPEQKVKPYKDRDSLETQAAAVVAKKDADVKHADQIVEKIVAAKEERPASHVDKLAAASADQQELASAAR